MNPRIMLGQKKLKDQGESATEKRKKKEFMEKKKNVHKVVLPRISLGPSPSSSASLFMCLQDPNNRVKD